jgi:FtsH-binding integral membrane protein
MFIGHFAAGMAAKKLEPSISLGTLFLAAQWLDLLWPTLLLLNLEHVVIAPGISAVTPLDFVDYPITHSLVMVLGWSLLFGAVYFLITRNKSGAFLLGALVLSHWVLDLVVHIPDLPLYPGDSPKVGFGIWNSLPLTIVVEGAVFVTGVLLYVKTRKSMGKEVSWWFWSLVIFLVVMHVANLFGPPPPNVGMIAWAGHLQWLFVLWAWRADK